MKTDRHVSLISQTGHHRMEPSFDLKRVRVREDRLGEPRLGRGHSERDQAICRTIRCVRSCIHRSQRREIGTDLAKRDSPPPS